MPVIMKQNYSQLKIRKTVSYLILTIVKAFDKKKFSNI